MPNIGALKIACPVCKAPIGKSCIFSHRFWKYRFAIAHALRRQLWDSVNPNRQTYLVGLGPVQIPKKKKEKIKTPIVPEDFVSSSCKRNVCYICTSLRCTHS